MICDNCIHNAVCEKAHFENHCGYKHTEADIINPELEKIKAETLAIFCNTCISAESCYKNDVVCSHQCKFEENFEQMLDNHIKELKGENKQSRCNSCQNNTDELSGECYECVKGIQDNYISEPKGEQE